MNEHKAEQQILIDYVIAIRALLLYETVIILTASLYLAGL